MLTKKKIAFQEYAEARIHATVAQETMQYAWEDYCSARKEMNQEYTAYRAARKKFKRAEAEYKLAKAEFKRLKAKEDGCKIELMSAEDEQIRLMKNLEKIKTRKGYV